MKSDVKAVFKSDTGSVFAGRCRLRGIIVANSSTAIQSLVLQDGDSVTQFQTQCPAGDVFAFNIPEDGILFKDGMTISTIGAEIEATILIDGK